MHPKSFAVAALGVSFIASPVVADPVDNPGLFIWDTGPGGFVFNQSNEIKRDSDELSGVLDSEIDENGDIFINAFTMGPVTVAPYTVRVQVTAGSSLGSLDASTGGFNASFTLELRVRITGNGVGTSCITPAFTANFEGDYNYDGVSMVGTMLLYSGTGGSVGGTTGWLTVPALTSCAGQQGTINSLLGFGVPGQGLAINPLYLEVAGGPFGS